MQRAFVVALLGAESTGKSTLAGALGAALVARGQRTVVVAEALREFCAGRGRTPHADEQQAIAEKQTDRIAAAAGDAGVDVVVADTTALMVAVYSELVFGDRSLYERAEAAQRQCDLTLLMALDLPWQADGLQRDGPQVQAPVDALVRAALARAGVLWAEVAGAGEARLASALKAIDRAPRVERR